MIPVPLQLPAPKKSIQKIRSFNIEDLVYAIYCSSRRNRNPRWASGVTAKARDPAFFTYALMYKDQYGNAILTRFVGVMLHLRITSRAIYLHLNCRRLVMCQQLNLQSLNLTFPHLIPCRNMDVIIQEDLNETEDFHFGTDSIGANVFPHYLFYWGGAVLYNECSYFML